MMENVERCHGRRERNLCLKKFLSFCCFITPRLLFGNIELFSAVGGENMRERGREFVGVCFSFFCSLLLFFLIWVSILSSSFFYSSKRNIKPHLVFYTLARLLTCQNPPLPPPPSPSSSPSFFAYFSFPSMAMATFQKIERKNLQTHVQFQFSFAFILLELEGEYKKNERGKLKPPRKGNFQ